MCVGTKDVDQTLVILKDIFNKHGLSPELRELDRGDEDGGKIVYELSLGTAVDTDKLSDEIIAEGKESISSLQWEQKKSNTYIYN